MVFRTAYNPLSAVDLPSHEGSPVGIKYEMRVSKEDGKQYVTPVAEFDIQAMIDEANNGIELKDLIERFNAGDVTAIPDPSFEGIDVSGAPKDMLEAHIRLEKAKNDFEQLDPETKLFYDNDFGTFLKQFVGQGSVPQKQEPVKVETVAPTVEGKIPEIQV